MMYMSVYKRLLFQYPKVPLRVLLKFELQDRMKSNPRYSMRAFASSFDVSVSTLSRFLSGERQPSHEFMQKICAKLEIPENKIIEFDLLQGPKTRQPTIKYKYLDQEHLVDVQHGDFALIELLNIMKYRGNVKMLADVLEKTEDEILKSRDRMVYYDILKI